jgi:hypothetical protein
MIVIRTFSRFRKISRDRFPCDTSIRHNDIYTERTAEIANNTIKKNSAIEFKRWINSVENYIPYWVATFRSKRNW